jgi:hypothetical protein
MPKTSAWIAFRIGHSGTQTIKNEIMLIPFLHCRVVSFGQNELKYADLDEPIRKS